MSDPLQPFSIMTLAQACIVRKTPVQLTSSTWSHRASVAGQPLNTRRDRSNDWAATHLAEVVGRVVLRRAAVGRADDTGGGDADVDATLALADVLDELREPLLVRHVARDVGHRRAEPLGHRRRRLEVDCKAERSSVSGRDQGCDWGRATYPTALARGQSRRPWRPARRAREPSRGRDRRKRPRRRRPGRRAETPERSALTARMTRPRALGAVKGVRKHPASARLPGVCLLLMRDCRQQRVRRTAARTPMILVEANSLTFSGSTTPG
jgi:hypothetical protein